MFQKKSLLLQPQKTGCTFSPGSKFGAKVLQKNEKYKLFREKSSLIWNSVACAAGMW
jgi:hypothetical protein